MIKKEKKQKKVDPLKLYFNSDTQRAIVEFQSTTEHKQRNRLYVTDIMPAFEKLVENLINIHKFAGLYDSYDDLKNDCVNFLFETIGKFDADRGTNAFSYFNVVAKNWLIIKTKQKSQKARKNVSLDDPNMLSSHEKSIVEDHCSLPPQDVFLEGLHASEMTTKILYEIREKARTENELMCINSIITIFENIDEIDLLNKNAILLYMRELSGLSPKQLTTTMQVVKKHYKKLKTEQRNEMKID
ncbi:MAG: hypothetical protein FJZ60_00805 [Chlamydiae bacterium]|nr:hypothetical protein [Chlamydiota bacterium]